MAATSVAILVALAAYGSYFYVTTHSHASTPTLVVDAYSSLFSGNCGSSALSALFASFEYIHSVRIQLVCPAGTLSSTLIGQKDAPQADLVIGLDEITAPQAEAAGVLVPYSSSELGSIPTTLVQGISPAHGVTPYEFGYLAFDYAPSFSPGGRGGVANFSFPEIALNASLARSVMIENPTTDITGQELLLWQIEFYAQVLHQDWKRFWTSSDPYIQVAPDWGTAYTAFTNPSSSSRAPGLVSSYSTDPASSSPPGSFNATFVHWNGSSYTWRAIYGLGIVHGSTHLALDRSFIDWFLQRQVQSQIPTNEWEYPANASTPLPLAFGAALDTTGVIALNSGLPPSSTPDALRCWLDQWQSLENAAPPGSC